MVNANRGPGGRFAHYKSDLQSKPTPRPSNMTRNDDGSNKKRRLNDGSSRPVPRTTSKQAVSTLPTAPSTPPPRQIRPPRQPSPTPPKRHASKSDDATPKADEKRTLRSQDATRRKSELVNFFADYEAVVFGGPIPDDYINASTPLLITENLPPISSIQRLGDGVPTLPSTARHKSELLKPTQSIERNATRTVQPPQAQLQRAQGPIFRKIRIQQRRSITPQNQLDPLSDDLYETVHRRGERKEKQSRNWDKERALHEKGELERLLQELKGPDWLKLMGIVGISEAESQKYKPKRNIFIRRGQSMLDRYAEWNKRDKELKLEKEQRLAEEDESSTEGYDSDDSLQNITNTTQKRKRPHRLDPKRLEPETSQQVVVEEQTPFTSFFDKSHMREAAMKSYRRGRHVLAFGVPIPELPDATDFELPHLATVAE